MFSHSQKSGSCDVAHVVTEVLVFGHAQYSPQSSHCERAIVVPYLFSS